jgi:hypothetical protein
MTFRRPPAVASWCLVNLSDPDEGLLGDLTEEYQRRQSRIWYWRQVAIAIVVTFARNVWSHKLETLQAIFTAMFAMMVTARLVREPVMWLLGTLFRRGWSLPPESWSSVYTWIGAALWFAAAVGVGAMVGRLHASRRATMILAIMLFGAASTSSLPEWYRLATNAISAGPRFAPYLVNSLVHFVIVSAGLFIGSLVAASNFAKLRLHKQ